MIQYTNEGFRNSEIPVQAVRHEIKKHPNMTDNINIDSEQMIQDFMNSMSKPELLNCADSAVLLVKDLRKGDPEKGVFNRTVVCRNFILLSKNGHNLLGHELGHNFGAKHNIEQEKKEGKTITGDNYGHLILPKGSGFRTIMSYSIDGHKERVNYYSNPDVNFPKTKQPTGIRGVSNNARVIRENRFLMEACGTEERHGKCNDCNTHPEMDKCKTTCCDTVHFNGTDPKFLNDEWHPRWIGTYTKYKEHPTHNGRDVYKHITEDHCLFYGGHAWQFNLCPKITTNFFSIRTQWTSNKCVDSGKLAWHPYEHDITMGVSCVKYHQ